MKKRNAAIDLLRIMSMCMIIILHQINKGLQIESLENWYDYTNKYILALSFCAVNVFVLISSYYLSEDNRIKIKTIATLLMENWIINFLVTLGTVFIGKEPFNYVDYLYIIFPFFTRRNWFLCVYLVLYLLHPFLNIIINRLNRNSYRVFLGILICVFCILPTIMPNRNWTFDKMRGYSIIWFVVLYFSVPYLKKYSNNGTKHITIKLISFFLIGFVMLLSSIIIDSLASVIGRKEISLYKDMWFCYDSLPVYIMSIILLSIFHSLSVDRNKEYHPLMLNRIISFFGSCTLGVYLIHDNYKLRDVLWTSIIKVETFSALPFSFILYILISVCVFFLCSCSYFVVHNIVMTIIKKFKVFESHIVIE